MHRGWAYVAKELWTFLMCSNESSERPLSLEDISLVAVMNWVISGPRLMFSMLLSMFMRATVAQEKVDV